MKIQFKNLPEIHKQGWIESTALVHQCSLQKARDYLNYCNPLAIMYGMALEYSKQADYEGLEAEKEKFREWENSPR